jgi:hypothetical protein
MTTAEAASADVQDKDPPVQIPAAGEVTRLRPVAAIRRYLQEVMTDHAGRGGQGEVADASRLPGLIFGIQTRREFCYLSGARVAPYRETALMRIGECVGGGEPVRYCLDIGGGYHASLRPGTEELSFEVGLGELLLLRQIRRFDARVRQVYPPGVRFSLVIDNLVAWLVNDIPVARTSAYCVTLRQLIKRVGLGGVVDLWVESEHLATEDFERLLPAHRVEPCLATLTRKDHETVGRFLGRSCDAQEAAERSARYREVTAVSTRLIDSRIRGLRMTQRATPQTICFRPFPGADSRIQSGQVALRTAAGGRLLPLLLTSHNQHLYDWCRIDFSDMLPAAIGQVIYADPAVRPQS